MFFDKWRGVDKSKEVCYNGSIEHIGKVMVALEELKLKAQGQLAANIYSAAIKQVLDAQLTIEGLVEYYRNEYKTASEQLIERRSARTLHLKRRAALQSARQTKTEKTQSLLMTAKAARQEVAE